MVKDNKVEETEDFEGKLKNAKEILERLSDPQIPLKDAMLEYKKGITILNEATKIIEDAKLEYEQLQFGQEN
ncbi:MAG: exodeoxyribonuclease VII small subunit [Sulfurospirillaceae bacterium]|nr:exodeoxyribonuclease VII small subunit [Sulfurospirillaceae bacterium]